MDYLIECSRSAREELLARVQHRDSYLKLHFLVQGVLLALSYGVNISGVEANGPVPLSLYLAVPLTAVFALLYYTEDRLIGQLSSYVGSLSNAAQQKSGETVSSWDVSPQLREYAQTTVRYRFFAHVAAFVVAPGVLLYLLQRFYPPTSWHQWGWCIVQVLILAALLVLSIKEFRYRKKTGTAWNNQSNR
jgi:hypothetical protein